MEVEDEVEDLFGYVLNEGEKMIMKISDLYVQGFDEKTTL